MTSTQTPSSSARSTPFTDKSNSPQTFSKSSSFPHCVYICIFLLLTFAWASMWYLVCWTSSKTMQLILFACKRHICHLLTLGVFVIDYFYFMYRDWPRWTDLDQAVIPAWFTDCETVKSSKTFEWNKEWCVGSSYFCYIRAIFFSDDISLNVIYISFCFREQGANGVFHKTPGREWSPVHWGETFSHSWMEVRQ